MRSSNGKPASLLAAAFIVIGCGSNTSTNSHWAGKTYLLDIPSKHWTKPSKDVGAEIAPFVPQFLFGVTGTADKLAVTVATAKAGVQNLCNQTQLASADETKYPSSQIVLPQFTMGFEELNTNVTPNETIRLTSTLHDLTFTDLLPSGSETSDGKFNVTTNIAELYTLFIRIQPQPPTVENVCKTLDSAGSACQSCAFSPDAKTCLTLGAEQLSVTEVDTVLKQVSSADIPSSCL